MSDYKIDFQPLQGNHFNEHPVIGVTVTTIREFIPEDPLKFKIFLFLENYSKRIAFFSAAIGSGLALFTRGSAINEKVIEVFPTLLAKENAITVVVGLVAFTALYLGIKKVINSASDRLMPVGLWTERTQISISH